MNYKLITIVFAVLLIIAGLCGCNEKKDEEEQADDTVKFIGKWDYLIIDNITKGAWIINENDTIDMIYNTTEPFSYASWELKNNQLCVYPFSFHWGDAMCYDYIFYNESNQLKLTYGGYEMFLFTKDIS